MRALVMWLVGPLLACPAWGADPAPVQLLHDPGFESAPAGKLDTPTSGKGWEVQRVGRAKIQSKLVVECVAGRQLARKGAQAVRLSLPRETVGFEFVTVGQRARLRADREYEAGVWVRWPDGPAKAPAKADATSGHPSAIVSFWVRHKDATGDFAGRDVWLFDRKWKKLTFRFRATDPASPSLIYVSLLPNQAPRASTALVDDFTLHERRAEAAAPKGKGQVVVDGDFAKCQAGAIRAGPWSFANIGGKKIQGEVVEENGARSFRIAMNRNTTNYESAQLWQMVSLEKGVRYEVQCRMRWDTYQDGPATPIVNYGLYHEPTNTWYGPIDQHLKKSKGWETYRFVHVPPYAGKWKLYVQLNGWGNFGRALTVSFDDFSCRPAK